MKTRENGGNVVLLFIFQLWIQSWIVVSRTPLHSSKPTMWYGCWKFLLACVCCLYMNDKKLVYGSCLFSLFQISSQFIGQILKNHIFMLFCLQFFIVEEIEVINCEELWCLTFNLKPGIPVSHFLYILWIDIICCLMAILSNNKENIHQMETVWSGRR